MLINYLVKIKKGLKETKLKQKSIYRTYYLTIFGLIPIVGFIVGFILIILGIFKHRSNTLIKIGCATALVNILVSFSFFSRLRPVSDKSNSIAITIANKLDETADFLEYYQLRYGHYPDSLGELRKLDLGISLNDPFARQKGANFFYKLAGEKYILFSVGKDGIPGTEDDIYPRKPILPRD